MRATHPLRTLPAQPARLLPQKLKEQLQQMQMQNRSLLEALQSRGGASGGAAAAAGSSSAAAAAAPAAAPAKPAGGDDMYLTGGNCGDSTGEGGGWLSSSVVYNTRSGTWRRGEAGGWGGLVGSVQEMPGVAAAGRLAWPRSALCLSLAGPVTPLFALPLFGCSAVNASPAPAHQNSADALLGLPPAC